MKVLLIGANGMLGPHVVKALEDLHQLRLTDIKDAPETVHEYVQLDVANLDAVTTAAKGMDAIVNLSVLRTDRKIAFDVNARGCYNVMTAAVKNGIKRVVNTGPHFTIAGPSYEDFDFDINSEIPPRSGTGLYAHTKSLGQEICRVFAANHDLFVITLLFYHFLEPDKFILGSPTSNTGFVPFSVTWEDAARVFAPALDIPLGNLPTRSEIFNILCDLPHGQFTNEKTKRILGWIPTDNLQTQWRKSPPYN